MHKQPAGSASDVNTNHRWPTSCPRYRDFNALARRQALPTTARRQPVFDTSFAFWVCSRTSKAGVVEAGVAYVCGYVTANQLVHFARDDQCRRSQRKLNCYKNSAL
ncbi:Hypothetical_protein [Hexamita inflata]|uniref:Hypothetical_protein n=1 Tax=Hexamita inflata TaxID=28002 RepID=A0AA86TLD3_9EUKA|nr:Hypothetical protein HINF_LOCUS8408 [Hexamita inflata]CAI9920771.1 Hypothetical protein HINF_LOCUS8416 [Hexamita inflata]